MGCSWEFYGKIFLMIQLLYLFAQLFIHPGRTSKKNTRQSHSECNFSSEDVLEDSTPTVPIKQSSQRNLTEDNILNVKVETLGKDILEIVTKMDFRRTSQKCSTADPAQSYQPVNASAKSSSSLLMGICAPTYQDAQYLPEWISFHQVMGFSQFLLYDLQSQDYFDSEYSGSGDGVRTISFTQSLNTSLFTVHEMARSAQTEEAYSQAYVKHCREKMKERGVQWLAFLNIDEFLYPLKYQETPTVSDSLLKHQNDLAEASCLSAIRLLYGSSFCNFRPQNLAIESYFLRQSHNDSETGAIMIHLAGPNLDEAHTCADPLPAPIFRVNRYLHSLEDLNSKACAGYKTADAEHKTTRVHANAFYQFIDYDINSFFDDSAMFYSCTLRQKMGMKADTQNNFPPPGKRIKKKKKQKGKGKAKGNQEEQKKIN